MADNIRTTTLRLDGAQAADLEAVARVDGQSFTDAVRTAIDEHIAARRADKDFQQRLKRSLEEHQALLERLAQ